MSVGADKKTRASADAKKKPWRFRLWHVLPVLLLSFFVWRNWSLPKSHSEQDECAFGTGSTAFYDQLRAEADAYLAKHGKARLPEYSLESGQIFADKVLTQLRAFAMLRETPTEKWVAIHALLRGYGMEFGFNSPRDKESLKNPFVVLSTAYYVQLPTLNWVCPLCYVFPLARFSFRLENRGDGVYDQISGGLRIRSLNWKWAGIHYRAAKTPCPRILK